MTIMTLFYTEAYDLAVAEFLAGHITADVPAGVDYRELQRLLEPLWPGVRVLHPALFPVGV